MNLIYLIIFVQPIFKTELNTWFWTCSMFVDVTPKHTYSIPSVGRPHLVSWRLRRLKRLTLPQERRNSPGLTFSWAGHWVFSWCQTWNWNTGSSWVSSLFIFRRVLYHELSWFSGLQTQTRIKPSAILGLQLTDSPCRSWDLPAFIITQANSL